MTVRLAHALNQVKALEKKNAGLLQEIIVLKKELAEANREKKILSRKTTVGKVSVKEDFGE